MYSDQQIEIWHQEYLQGMKKILTDAANEIHLERIKEDIYSEEDDDWSLAVFIYKKCQPLNEMILYFIKNNPFLDNPEYINNSAFPRYSLSDIFDFLSEATDYGKYCIANEFPGNDTIQQQLEDALFSGDKELFLDTIDVEKVDFDLFRRRVRGAMYMYRGLEEMLDAGKVLFDSFEDDDAQNETVNKVDTILKRMINRSPLTANTVMAGLNKYGDELIEDHTDSMSAIYKVLSDLNFSDDDVWATFGGCRIILIVLFSLGKIKTEEQKVINDFLDDPETNSILNGLERVEYVLSHGETEPGSFFVPQPLKGEIESGFIDKLTKVFWEVMEEEEEEEVKPEEKQREYSKDDLRWLTDEAFSGYDPVGNEKAYFQASMIGTSTALRMSTIYKLFLFLTSQGKLGKSQEVLDLLTFRLTGKDPYGIDKTRKLAWKGTKSDYSLCYFLWKMFSKELEDGKTYQYDSRFWRKAEDFFVYANGKSVIAGDEQSNRQQFTEKTGKDAEDSFAIALRGELATLHKEQLELEREK